MQRTLLLLFLFSLSGLCKANYILVYFKDKNLQQTPQLSAQNLRKHQRQCIPYDEKDLPINTAYIETVLAMPLPYFGSSRWLNAICVDADAQQEAQILQLPFVAQTEHLNVAKLLPLQTHADLPPGALLSSEIQLDMLQLGILHQNGFTGKGITIAVFDNGFTRVDDLGPYRHIFNENRLLQSRNFVDPSRSVFQMGTDGDHGSRVFSVLAAVMPPAMVGSAIDANYLLAVTEDMTREGVLEEWNWLRAAEWADSLGADIISSSLGYATGFTYGGDHTFDELDGRTTLISRAANLAASRGILVVNSAGNEGNVAWRHIIAPADADSCLAVGSVDAYRNYSNFSSQGPSYDGRIKPDVAAMGGLTITLLPQGYLKTGNGTSFSCPLMAGLAACLWQADSTLPNMQLFRYIKESGHLKDKPDTFLGYGIPNGADVYTRISGKSLNPYVHMANQLTVFPNPCKGEAEISWYNYADPMDAELEIVNNLGARVFYEKIKLQKGYQRLPLPLKYLNLPQGVYYLSIKGFDPIIIFENKLLISE